MVSTCIFLCSNTPKPLRLASDDRCPQIWNRPPQSSDLGLKEVHEWIQRKEDTSHLPIYAEPIPCDIQTTHPYPYHVEIYLRRRGIEVEVEEVSTAKDAMIIWTKQSQIFQNDILRLLHTNSREGKNV